MPRASASVNHTGFLPPRPDQVSGPSGFLYFGANAAPETAERGLTSDGRRSSRAVKRNFAHNDAHSFRISSRMAFFSASSIAWRASTSSSRAFRAERSVDSDMKKKLFRNRTKIKGPRQAGRASRSTSRRHRSLLCNLRFGFCEPFCSGQNPACEAVNQPATFGKIDSGSKPSCLSSAHEPVIRTDSRK